MHPIERLRELMITTIRPPFEVSRKRTQYAFGEDDEFFTDIDVQHPVDGFVLAVTYARGDRIDAFVCRVLHRRVPEVWLVDQDDRFVLRCRRDHPVERFTRADTLVSVQVPSLRVPLTQIFATPSSSS